MIVDAHVHAGTGDGFTGPWDTEAPLGDYLRRADAAGITHSVLLAAFAADYARANAEVAAIVRRAPHRFFAFCFVHAVRDRGRIGALFESGDFVGIKVHRHDAPITREICEAAHRHRAPVLYDVAGDVAPIELFATQYPDVAFVIPHLGSFADDWKAQLQLIDMLERHPNVFTDSAGVRRFDLLEQAVARAGAGKLLFGSDGPWLHPGVELAKIDALALGPTDRRRVLAGNFLRLTRFSRRARCARSRPSRSRRVPTHA
jgi:uncharacterized protein